LQFLAEGIQTILPPPHQDHFGTSGAQCFGLLAANA
jgi:hypothetical protein